MQMGQHRGFDVFLDWAAVIFGVALLGAIGWAGYKVLNTFIEF